MKNKLPLILLGIGILVVGLTVFFVVKNSSSDGDSDDVAIEIDFPDRPVASLTPSDDGHWIKLVIDKIQIAKASSMDYELLYSLPDGRTQGVPGNVKLDGATSIERDLLLGSESSGKFRYDEGVETGTLTLRFRNSKGKLLAKFSTKFHLQTSVAKLTSVDENFTYELEESSDSWYITMQSFGLPSSSSVSEVTSGPYGVFTSDSSLPEGTADGWEVVSSNLFYK
ncbi:hypothetical protein ISR94_03980 [Candidatus Microgenomates bacterium]|nr:hypothetical protein [Candidatus Microgenomates bacterium]